jgi:hypothetical protein
MFPAHLKSAGCLPERLWGENPIPLARGEPEVRGVGGSRQKAGGQEVAVQHGLGAEALAG